MTYREQIVQEAKEWIGTPYMGWACRKGIKGGCDCGQLLKGVFLRCSLLSFPDGLPLPVDYSLQLAQHKETGEYLGYVQKYMREITEAEIQPGDVVLYRMGHDYAHAGIVVQWPDYIIHALGSNGVTGTHGTKFPKFHKRPRRFFTVKDEFINGHTGSKSEQ